MSLFPVFRFLSAEIVAALVVITVLGGGPQLSYASTPPGESYREPLIPAAFGIRTDREGNSWSVEPNGNIGRIGNTMANSGLALMINEEKFSGFQPMMTPDAAEFVFPGLPLESLPGLQVQRRVRLLEKPGGLRYAEMFYNGSTDPVTFTVALVTNFSGNYKTFLSERGRTEPITLADSETGIVVLPGSSQSAKAFLFTLADSWSPLKPTISAPNRYGLTFRYQVTLGPGETGVIVHHVAQVVIPQSFDRLTLLNLAQPYSFGGIRDPFPEDWKRYVLNAGEVPGETMRSALALDGLESLGFTGGTRDILAIGEQTRLSGTAEGEGVRLKGAYEGLEFGLDRVAAIVGKGRNRHRESKLYLKDGQVFNAPIEAPGLSFLQSGGSRVPLDPATLDRLFLADAGKVTDWTGDSVALIETFRGDRLKVLDPASFFFQFATPWGALPVSLENLVWLKPAPEGVPGHWVELKDGTRCFGYITGESTMVGLTDIENFRLDTSELKSIFTPDGLKSENARASAGGETVTRIFGNQEVVGPITNTEIPVTNLGNRIDTATTDIRRIRRIDEDAGYGAGLNPDSPIFQVERWDGGLIDGYLNLEFISLKVAGRAWQVPVRDLQQIDNASPLLTPEILTRIQGLVESLASEDWETRETATRDLGAFGYLARPVLQRELGSATDPEVGRRLERVLSEMN